MIWAKQRIGDVVWIKWRLGVVNTVWSKPPISMSVRFCCQNRTAQIAQIKIIVHCGFYPSQTMPVFNCSTRRLLKYRLVPNNCERSALDVTLKSYSKTQYAPNVVLMNVRTIYRITFRSQIWNICHEQLHKSNVE